jgi:hypothetical protein
MTRCTSSIAPLSHQPVGTHACLCRDLYFDTVVHTVVLEYNCLITDNLVESTRLAEAKEPAQSGPVFDPLGSITGLGSKVTGAGSEVKQFWRFAAPML